MLDKNINLIHSVFIVLVLILVTSNVPELSVIFLAIGLIQSVSLVLSRKGYVSLALSVGCFLFLGFVLIANRSLYIESMYAQLSIAFSYAVFGFLMFSVWFTSYVARKYMDDISDLKKTLSKYDSKDYIKSILTEAEFMDKRNFILSGARVRNESVSFAEIGINCNQINNKKVVVDKVGQIIGANLRQNYDIFTVTEKGNFSIVFQDLTSIGGRRILENIKRDISSKISMDGIYISYTCKDIVKRASKEVTIGSTNGSSVTEIVQPPKGVKNHG